MVNVNEKGFRFYSMPIHHPFYAKDKACFRMVLIEVRPTVGKPEIISNIIPEPLAYKGNEIIVALSMITELKAGFSENDTLWEEIAIRIPVIYKNEELTYQCEIFSTKSFRGNMMDRETFGFPRVPAKLSVERNGKTFKAILSEFETSRDMLNFSFKALPVSQASSLEQYKKKPHKLILFKYIPSVSFKSNEADVKQLVEMKYKKPVIHELIPGEGNVELLEDAPSYLKEAGIVKIGQSIYHDMELDIIGGKVFYDYIKGGRIWQR